MKRIILGAALLLAAAALPTATRAQSVTIGGGVNYNNGFDALNIQVSQAITVAGTNRYSAVLTVTNGLPQQVTFGSTVPTPGLCFVRDVSPTNVSGYVQLGGTNGNMFIRLAPGEPAIFRLDSTNLFLNTTAGTHYLGVNVLPN